MKKLFKDEQQFEFYQQLCEMPKSSGVLFWYKNKDQQRVVKECRVFEVNRHEGIFYINVSLDFFQDLNSEVFFYLDDLNFIFKAHLSSRHKKATAVFDVPDFLTFLNATPSSVLRLDAHRLQSQGGVEVKADAAYEKYLHAMAKIKAMTKESEQKGKSASQNHLSEEDFFETLREAPRQKPKDVKEVTFMRQDKKKKESLEIYDLSRGGLALIVESQKTFKVGEQIWLTVLDQKKLNPPIAAICRRVEQLPEFPSLFKAGFQFKN